MARTSIFDIVGSTPLVLLPVDVAGQAGSLYAKLEFRNPAGSFKDRLAVEMIKELANQDDIKTVVVSSASLALSLATFSASKYRILAVIPDGTSDAKIAQLKFLGVEIVRTPSNHMTHPDAPESPYSTAQRIANETRNTVLLDELRFDRSDAVFRSLIDEILEPFGQSPLSALVVSSSSIEDIDRFGRIFKEKSPASKLVVTRLEGHIRQRIQSSAYVDEWITVAAQQAALLACKAAKRTGVLGGLLAGSVLAVAAEKSVPAARVVAVCDDGFYDHHSTLQNSDWLIANGVFEASSVDSPADKYRGASVEDLQLPEAVSVLETSTVGFAMDLMISRDFSQLPVINTNRKMVGFVSLGNLQSLINTGELGDVNDALSKWMYSFERKKKDLRIITPATPLAELEHFFDHNPAAFVTDESAKFPLAVLTKYDILKFLGKRG